MELGLLDLDHEYNQTNLMTWNYERRNTLRGGSVGPSEEDFGFSVSASESEKSLTFA